jgi:hypothetical protein
VDQVCGDRSQVTAYRNGRRFSGQDAVDLLTQSYSSTRRTDTVISTTQIITGGLLTVAGYPVLLGGIVAFVVNVVIL